MRYHRVILDVEGMCMDIKPLCCCECWEQSTTRRNLNDNLLRGTLDALSDLDNIALLCVGLEEEGVGGKGRARWQGA